MNTVQLIGNLARDPELRYSTGQNQMAICRFTIAVNDGFGEKQKTSFIRIVTFGKQAESCDRYLKKGRKVAVTGKIQTGSYEDKDGKKVYTTDVVVEHQEFAESKANSGASSANAGEQTPPPAPTTDENGFMSIPDGIDEDLPFQ